MRIGLIIVVILTLFFALTAGPAKRTQSTQQQLCVSVPDPKQTVFYNNAEYRRIRRDTPIYYRELAIHFVPTQPQELFIDGTFRPAYVPWFDGILDDKYVFWRPIDGVNNLLFVDVSKDRAGMETGFRYFDIYLKPRIGSQYVIPKFIQIFCSLNYPIGKKVMYPDENGNFIPPATIKPIEITDWKDGDGSEWISTVRPPTDKLFNIFMYEHIDMPSADLFKWRAAPSGKLRVTSGSINKEYKVVYIPNVIDMIMIMDTDTNSPDGKLIYLYTYAREEFQPQLYKGVPTNNAKKNLQLETFNYPVVNAWAWWNPECKPAIYLYPEKKTDVHVTVRPAGYLTYTDPPYPENGWNVTAYPDGAIFSNNKQYPYLYYESAIADSAIQKPKTGYVVKFDELPGLFTDILPRMGLNSQETKDFKEYWEKTLPNAPYYFVGVMENEAIDRIEPLTIQPKEDTIIRVRLYFEALDAWRSVEAPTLNVPERKGFVVSEWGGLVKTDKNHPFTCSQ